MCTCASMRVCTHTHTHIQEMGNHTQCQSERDKHKTGTEIPCLKPKASSGKPLCTQSPGLPIAANIAVRQKSWDVVLVGECTWADEPRFSTVFPSHCSESRPHRALPSRAFICRPPSLWNSLMPHKHPIPGW